MDSAVLLLLAASGPFTSVSALLPGGWPCELPVQTPSTSRVKGEPAGDRKRVHVDLA